MHTDIYVAHGTVPIMVCNYDRCSERNDGPRVSKHLGALFSYMYLFSIGTLNCSVRFNETIKCARNDVYRSRCKDIYRVQRLKYGRKTFSGKLEESLLWLLQICIGTEDRICAVEYWN